MKLLKQISWLCTAILCLVLATSCSEDETMSSRGGTGYIKLYLTPLALTRVAALDQMSNAKKVELSLLHGDKPIVQSLSLSSTPGNADLGLESEKLELIAGSYKLMSYTLLSGVKPGAEQPERLITVYPEEDMIINISNGHITEIELKVKATIRGKVYFDIQKDLSNFKEWSDKANSRAIDRDEADFNYNDVEEVDLYYRKKGSNEHSSPHAFKVYKGEKLLHTDTVNWEVGDYEITRYMLYTKNRAQLLLAGDLTNNFVKVAPNVYNQSAFDVKYPANMACIKDYMALYTIWINMDGPEWKYSGQSFPTGANWRFKDRPVDEWGDQPGVELSNSGRVKALDLGAFNPVGAIPEELGNLTEVETLWLGTHNDLAIIDDDSDMKYSYTLDTYKLYRSGVDLGKNRIKIGKERLRAMHPKKTSNVYTSGNNSYQFVSQAKYDVHSGELTNRIESIPASIKNLKRLTFLFIANGRIGDNENDIPVELAELPNLTDVEFYNCPFKEFPKALKLMNKVVSLNFSANKTIPSENFTEGLNEFLLSNKATLQILYLSNCNLETFPINCQYATKVVLLDMAFNKLRKLPGMRRTVAPVQVFFDNNKIDEIADDFCDTDDIETFSIPNNLIKEFPNLFGNGIGSSSKFKATNIDFSDNRITHFKEGFKGINVEEFNLSLNLFGKRPGGTVKGRRTFPNDLSDTNSKINFLEISHCEIDSLTPSCFKNLKSMQAIDLSSNYLRYIPRDFNIEILPYMSGLELSKNCFTLFPVEVLNVQGLQKLFLNDQLDIIKGKEVRCMKQWPEGIYKHLGLRVLDISGNNIQKITEAEFPTQLAVFNIVDNPNIEMTIPSYVCSLISTSKFQLGFDSNQYILGCPILDLDINK